MIDCYAPGESEQEEAWEYVCKRELTRPDTNIFKALKYMMLFIGINAINTLATFLLLRNFFTGKTLAFSSIILQYPLLIIIAIYFAFTISGLILFSKRAIIGLVRLYQHYAPERIRRKCIFKPTCSEYMVLAIEKYGVIKGLYKGIYRMFFRCSGFYYSIDYP